MTGLGGTGQLADDLYLVAHHEITGKPYLQPRSLGVGLAGGLLGELMLSGSIRLWRGLIIPGASLAVDDLTHGVLDAVTSEPRHLAVQDWLRFLARDGADGVASRLAAAGYLTRAPGRHPWRAQRWIPVDPDCAFAPLTRVKSALTTPGPRAAQNAVLGGLATACGLGPRLSLYLPPDLHRRLDQAIAQLQPSLRELIASTQATADIGLLSHRT